MIRRDIQILACAAAIAAGGSVAAQAQERQPPDEPAQQAPQQEPQSEEGSGQPQAPAMPGLAQLDRAEKEALQEALQEQGMYEGAIDGVFGEESQQALRDFQRENGLEEQGITRETVEALGVDLEQARAEAQTESEDEAADEEMQAADEMGEAERKPVSGQAQPSQPVDISALDESQVQAMQEKLQQMGYYRGAIDGMAGSDTQQALQQFYMRQARHAARGEILPEGAQAFGLSEASIERVGGEQSPEKEPMRGEEEQPGEEQAPQEDDVSPMREQPYEQ